MSFDLCPFHVSIYLVDNSVSADCASVPAALELRFMPDPPTLSSYGVHRLNKSDSLELTCRYVHRPVAGMYLVHGARP